MNQYNLLPQNFVFPAVSIPRPACWTVDCLLLVQAGIQQGQASREADKTSMLFRFAGDFYNHLDSRLRGNDGLTDYLR